VTRLNVLARFVKGLFLVTLTVLVFYQLMPTGRSENASQGAKIELFLSNGRPLRGEILKVTGRLSSVSDDLSIPLVSVRLQYFRMGDENPTRDVTMITSSPSGTFQDLVNTTYLLRIGPWIVTASFPAQLIYLNASTVKTFTVVVQPSLSLYVIPHQVNLDQKVEFNGLLFACIPCLDDKVTIALIRPDNTSEFVTLALNATGGPYPGGYYDGSFTPNISGIWHIVAIWKGNNVTLPTQSQVEELDVETPGGLHLTLLPVTLLLVAGAILLIFVLKRKNRNKG
jgi:hypothetical protein